MGDINGVIEIQKNEGKKSKLLYSLLFMFLIVSTPIISIIPSDRLDIQLSIDMYLVLIDQGTAQIQEKTQY